MSFHFSANCNTSGALSPPFLRMPQVCVRQRSVLIRNWGSQRGRSCQRSALRCSQDSFSTVLLNAHAASMPICSSSPRSLFFTCRKPAARALPFREFSGRTRAEAAPACCSCTKASPSNTGVKHQYTDLGSSFFNPHIKWVNNFVNASFMC